MKETKQLRNLMESIDVFSKVEEADFEPTQRAKDLEGHDYQKAADKFKASLKGLSKPAAGRTDWDSVNLKSVEIDGVDTRDHPDYSDAYVSYAEWADGTELTDEELVGFEEANRDWVHERAYMQGVGAE